MLVYHFHLLAEPYNYRIIIRNRILDAYMHATSPVTNKMAIVAVELSVIDHGRIKSTSALPIDEKNQSILYITF